MVRGVRVSLAAGGARFQIARTRLQRAWQYETNTVAHVLDAHSGAVRSVSFAPGDGSVLVSGGDDAEIQLWDAVSRVPTRTLRGHTVAVNTVAWSRSTAGEAVLASGAQDGAVIVWAPLERKTITRAQPIRRRQPSPSSRSVAAGSTRELCLICLDRRRSSRLRPCLHVVACETCVLGLIARGDARCVTCRSRITGFDVGEFNIDDPTALLAKPALCANGCTDGECAVS